MGRVPLQGLYYTLARNIRELQLRLVGYLTLHNYTLARNIRELQPIFCMLL